MTVATIVRTFEMFTNARGHYEHRLAKVLELPLRPARGQRVCLSGVAEPLPIERVVLTAREPAGPGALTPGWKVASAVHVLLAPESPDALTAAVASGWTPITRSH